MRFLLYAVLISFTCHVKAQNSISYLDSIKGELFEVEGSRLADTLRIIGIDLKDRGKLIEADLLLNESLKYFTVLKDSFGIADCFNNLGNLRRLQNNKSEAISFYYRALVINEMIYNLEGLGKNYINVANFYNRENDLSKALEYYYKVTYLDTIHVSKKDFANAQNGIGSILSNKNYNKYDFNTAVGAYSVALMIYQQLQDTINIKRIYGNLGLAYENIDSLQRALDFYFESKLLQKRNSDFENSAILDLNIGNIYKKMNRYEDALKYYQNGIQASKSAGASQLYLYILSNILEVKLQLGLSEEAIPLYKELKMLRDSVYNMEKTKQIAELRTRFETDSTLQKNEYLLLENKVQNRQNLLLLTAFIIVTVFAVWSMIYYHYRQKVLKEINKKDREISQKEMERLTKEKELQSVNALLQGQEDERRRIAEDLHDRLGGKLSAIKLFHLSSKDADKKERIARLLEETIMETREISHNLSSANLNKFGLQTALEDLFNTLQRSQKIEARISFVNLKERLPVKLERALYAIVQEFVNNTLRHSRATALNLQLTNHPRESLNLIYEDNGIGFTRNELEKGGMGLSNIKARLTPFSGHLTIDSNPGKGAVFLVDIPLLLN